MEKGNPAPYAGMSNAGAMGAGKSWQSECKRIMLFRRCARRRRDTWPSTSFSGMSLHHFRLRCTRERQSCSSPGVYPRRKWFQLFVPPTQDRNAGLSAESACAPLDLGADYLGCKGTEAGGHVQATRGLYEVTAEASESQNGAAREMM